MVVASAHFAMKGTASIDGLSAEGPGNRNHPQPSSAAFGFYCLNEALPCAGPAGFARAQQQFAACQALPAAAL
jgi:hypothetical protein